MAEYGSALELGLESTLGTIVVDKGLVRGPTVEIRPRDGARAVLIFASINV